MKSLRIWYEGREITNTAQVVEVVITDRYGSIPDETELTLWDEDGIWGNWDPRPGDRLRVVADGFDTGELRLDNPKLDGRHCRLRAISAPLSVRSESWGVMQEISLTEIARRCAREAGLALNLYGISTDPRYKRVARGNKTPISFLVERCDLEGVAVKVDDGRVLLIDWGWAGEQEPAVTIDLSNQRVAEDWRAWDRTKSVELLCSGMHATSQKPWDGRQILRDDVAYYSQGEGLRFSENLLADKLRQERKLPKILPFTPGIAALSAVDVKGGASVAGRWIAAQVVHQPVADKTELLLVKAVAE